MKPCPTGRCIVGSIGIESDVLMRSVSKIKLAARMEKRAWKKKRIIHAIPLEEFLHFFFSR
jgi:hypothetical protein